ncbi:MAG: AAA family ATPase [Clostridia bacterium]|nr:AAA family ATPase [Clostridia bacterium]
MANSNDLDGLFLPKVTDIGNIVSDVVVVVNKIVFNNRDFFIFYCKGNFSVKGRFQGSIVNGLSYKISGKVGQYGQTLQIEATSIELVDIDGSDSMIIASFLKNNFDGLGERTSLSLAKEFGENVLEEFVKRPKSVANKIFGLSEKKASTISQQISDDRLYYDQILGLRLLGLTEDNSKKTYEMFGMASISEVKNNPYHLLRVNGIGFDTCEYIAQGMELDKFDRMRILGAVLCVLNEWHYTSGNTYIDANILRSGVRDIIYKDGNSNCDTCDNKITCSLNTDTCELFEPAFKEAILYGVEVDDIVVYHFVDDKCVGCGIDEVDARIALKRIFKIEAAIKSEVSSFVNAPCPDLDEDKANETINRLALGFGIQLDELQNKALQMCMTKPLCIITGGPGTGKTTITGILAEHFAEKKIDCVFCAPTGRAAKRLAESIGREANTIHRLLGVKPSTGEDGFEYGRNQENKLEARVIVVDEASMVENSLFLALLRAIKPNSSLILIGDPNQLPSVGPGNLLADLLSCKSISRVELKYVFRQNDDSSIAANAYRILNGEPLKKNDTDFVIHEVTSEDDALNHVFDYYSKYGDSDMVILSPTKLNNLGTVSLNREIQGIVAKPHYNSISVGSSFYRERDRVMQIKNNYNIEFFDALLNETVSGVYNGELGQIVKIDEDNKTVEVAFDDGKNVLYEGKTLEDIDLAYAMTVHKAQGCEFDTVVIVLGKMSYHLLNRKILYTAVTRGKKRVLIISLNNALSKMLGAVDVNKRQTSLVDFMRIIDAKRNMN